MPKRSYIKRNTAFDSVIGGKYFVEERDINLLISTRQDGNMDPRFSEDALFNYQTFLEKHGFPPAEAFSPALGQNYRVITIDESNEENYTGRFVKNGTPSNEYRCDAVIVCGSNIPVAFRVGDCPVVLIVGDIPGGEKIISLIHVGRAELSAGVLKNTIIQMVTDHKMHIRSATTFVFPHICKHCYVLQYVDQTTKEKAGDFLEFSKDHFHLDLLGWLTNQLEENGIQRISTAFSRCTAGISPVCTSRLLHDMKIFKGLFSHYRSFHRKDLEDPEGRFVIVARIIDKDCEEDPFQKK